jgi:hypothetical protein
VTYKLTGKGIESDGKKRKKGEKGEKVTERKIGNMHLLESFFCRARVKWDVKIDGNKG